MNGGSGDSTGVSSDWKGLKELRGSEGRTAGIFANPARRRKSSSKTIAITIVAVMALSACLGAVSVASNGHSGQALRAHSMFLAHSPILIEGDDALTGANGITAGSGTFLDPYIIEGWNIDASTSDIGAVAISNTTSYLEIRNVYAHSGGSTSLGIALVNVTNVAVTGCIVAGNSVGIGVYLGANIAVDSNKVNSSDSSNIIAFDSSMLEINGNIVVDCPGIGITLLNCSDVSIEENVMAYNGVAGLALEMTYSAYVANNVMRANEVGIFAMSANVTYITENVITNSTSSGVMMMGCNNNTLYSNIIASTSAGEGATMMLGADNSIYHNDFIDNGASPQASDDSLTDSWNASYPEGGNYWSDHNSPDDFSGPDQNVAGSDGIVDTPYVLGGLSGVQDSYPLASPVTTGTAPFAFFVYVPELATAPATFTFNASLCWDPDDSPGSLEVRWDWESDGIWDTGWSTDKSAAHEYGLAGSYNVTMEVRDTAGHSDNYTAFLEVEELAIPEFPGLVIPIISMIGLLLVVAAVRRR